MDMQSDVPCTTADLKPLRDDVVKQLVIVPEGQPIVKTRTSLICPKDQSREASISWNVTLPNDRIPNSERAYINVVPDLVGLTSENMNKLLPVPKDCGEQNMLLLMTSFLALKYMDAFAMNNPEIREKAIMNLEDAPTGAEQFCPVCTEKLPSDIRDIYRSAKSVVKVAIGPFCEAKICTRSVKRLGATIEFTLSPNCSCSPLDTPGSRALIINKDNDFLASGDHKQTLNDSYYIYGLPPMCPVKWQRHDLPVRTKKRFHAHKHQGFLIHGSTDLVTFNPFDVDVIRSRLAER